MKKYLLILMCAWTLGAQAQTLRDAVAVVRPNYTESTIKFLNNFSASLRKDGYADAANVLAAYASGGYGTGFLWKNTADGRFYIITNRHVVARAKDVNIEFMPTDAPEVKYTNCRIVAVDEGAEMAVIALPVDASFETALTFATAKPADGDEVYTAGFPGLGSDPSWQLGKGIVSNSSAKLKDWKIRESAKIIQHTAQVDAGSSGGPLLVKDGSTIGYSVIGINTWQARHRENANFSVASSTVQEFLNGHFVQSNVLQSAENLRNRAHGFANAVKEGYQQVYQYISDDYIGNISVNDFYELLGSLADSIATEVGGCFGNGLPVDGVRICLAEALSSYFGKDTMSLVDISDFLDSAAKVTFDYGGTRIASDWTFSNGEWSMSAFAALSMRDMAKSGVVTTFGYRNAVMLGLGFPGNNLAKINFTLTYEYTLATFVLYGLDISNGSFVNPYSEWVHTESGNPVLKDTTRTVGNTGFGFHAGMQLPVKLGSVYVIPNVKGYAGINFMKDPMDDGGMAAGYGYSFGVNGAYKLKWNKYLIGGLQYRAVKFAGNDYSLAKPRLIELLVGITF